MGLMRTILMSLRLWARHLKPPDGERMRGLAKKRLIVRGGDEDKEVLGRIIIPRLDGMPGRGVFRRQGRSPVGTTRISGFQNA